MNTKKSHLVALSWHVNGSELLSVVLLKLLGHTTLQEGVVSNQDADVCKANERRKVQMFDFP